MAAYANVPVNSPSVLSKLPSMLFDPTSPLSIKLTSHLPTMLPWAALFAWNCRPAAVQHTAAALGALLSRADRGYEAVWKQAGVDVDGPMGVHASSVVTSTTESGPAPHERPFAVRQGYLLLQRTEEAMRASEAGAALRERHITGLRMEALSADEVSALEPALSSESIGGGAWFFPDGWFLTEPAALLRALAAGFERGGGELRTGTAVTSIHGASGGGASVVLDNGASITADEVVVAAGAHSAPLVSSLGEFCPLDTERGYHVAFGEGSEQSLSRAVCDPSVGWIASPMAGGLRVAGKVELGGVHGQFEFKCGRGLLLSQRASDVPSFALRQPPPLLPSPHASRLTPRPSRQSAPPTPARWDAIESEAQAMITGYPLGPRNRDADWLGFRPTMPDALPVIGRSRKLPLVYYAFGHQHVGWTLGGITGELVAQMIEGKTPSVDLAPYSLDRFRLLPSFGLSRHPPTPTAASSSAASSGGGAWRGGGGATAAMVRRAASTLVNGSSSQLCGSDSDSSTTSGSGGVARGGTSQRRPFSTATDPTEVLRPLPLTMRHTTYAPGCAADELAVGESPLPSVGADDVLIQVAYSGVGGTDFAQRKGNFNPKAGSPDHHLIMGLEVSGLVAKVGENVTDFSEGQRVCALLYGGGYSQYAVAPQQQVLELPDAFSLAEGQ